MEAKTYEQPPVMAWAGNSIVPIVPFPELPIHVTASKLHPQDKLKEQRRPSEKKKQMEPTSHALRREKHTSSPIPFPKAHVKRTPSELQLDQNELKARYDVVKMNARIAIGKQLRARCYADMFLTKNPVQKSDKAAEAESMEHQQPSSGGWDLSYIPIDDDCSPRSSREGSGESSVHSMQKGDSDDDDNDIFSLEL
jgi:hypothetical protein